MVTKEQKATSIDVAIACFAFPIRQLVSICSHTFGALVTNMQSDVQETLQEKMASLYFGLHGVDLGFRDYGWVEII